MSKYLPTIWKNNIDPSINATNLNHLETGVMNAHLEIQELVDGTVPAGQATNALVAESVEAASRLNLGGIYLWVDTTGPLPVGYIGV